MGTTVGPDKFSVTEKAIDHGVDAVCAIALAAVAITGHADGGVVAGLVSIALGKRVMGGGK